MGTDAFSRRTILVAAFLGAKIEDLSVHCARDAGGGRDIRAAHWVLFEFPSGAHDGRLAGRASRRGERGAETLEDASEDRPHEPEKQDGEDDESEEEPDHGIGARRDAP